MEIPELKLNRARELIHTSKNVSLATTNDERMELERSIFLKDIQI
jgi:hypothetical protein